MATSSVYNIKIDNNLAFSPGVTAGYVLSINADGSTSWISAGGGGATGPGGSAGSAGATAQGYQSSTYGSEVHSFTTPVSGSSQSFAVGPTLAVRTDVAPNCLAGVRYKLEANLIYTTSGAATMRIGLTHSGAVANWTSHTFSCVVRWLTGIDSVDTTSPAVHPGWYGTITRSFDNVVTVGDPGNPAHRRLIYIDGYIMTQSNQSWNFTMTAGAAAVQILKDSVITLKRIT